MVEAALAYLRQGGWVMVPLVVVCAVMWTLILERWQVLRELSRSDLGLTTTLKAVHGDETLPAGAGLRDRLVNAFLDRRSGRLQLDRQILAQCERDLARNLDKRLAAIAVLAAVAPLLGLLGTVLGMIETFQVIADFGTGNARALAGGISVALVTTQTGLLVAIPGLVLSGRLRDHAEQLRLSLAETTRMLDRELGQIPTVANGGGR
jgi:biopolymer transport protein ExbB